MCIGTNNYVYKGLVMTVYGSDLTVLYRSVIPGRD